jgi:hypothetical protein
MSMCGEGGGRGGGKGGSTERHKRRNGHPSRYNTKVVGTGSPAVFVI